MSSSDLMIRLGADWTGRPAFDQAMKASNSLNSEVSKLGKTFAGVFSAYKIAQFGKNAAKAFMEDQQAAKVLAANLRGIGFGDVAAGAEQFISQMEAATGVMDDQLRPAYAQLTRVTGSMVETQKLLNSAWNISAGTGSDFQSVVDALSQAYVGNVKGLKSLNTGLTNAELSGKSFSEIMDLLNQQFGSSGQAALNSYAGQLGLLSVAVTNAMETIGKSILDSFAILNGDQGIGGTVNAIDEASFKFGNFLRMIAAGAGVLKTAFDPKSWFDVGKKKAEIDAVLKEFRLKQSLAEQQRAFKEWIPSEPITAAQKKAAAEAALRAKQLADATKKQAAAAADLLKKKKEAAALDALSLKYKQAESIFDLQKIELAAAAMSKQSAEDYARIQLKRDLIALNEAIQSGDLVAAQAAAKVVEEDYKRVQAYQAINIALGIQNGTIVNIKNAASLIPTDLSIVNLDNLKSALAYINELLAQLAKLPTAGSNGTGTKSAGAGGSSGLPSLFNPDGTPSGRGTNNIPPLTDSAMETFMGNLNDAVKVLNDNATALKPLIDSGFFDLSFNAAEFSGVNINPYALTDAQATAYSQAQTAKITIVDNTSGLIDVITDATQQASANGINTRLVRNTGSLSW